MSSKITTTYTCDKPGCNNTFEKWNHIWLGYRTRHAVLQTVDSEGGTKTLDLCDECSRNLTKWWLTKEIEVEI